MRIRSLQGRIALVVLGVGLLAILVDSGVLGGLLTKPLISSSGADLALHARAISACCLARSPGDLLAATEIAATSGQGGTATRFALVIDRAGRPVTTRSLPATVERTLLADYNRQALEPSGRWTTASGMIVAQAPIILHGRRLGTLLLAEDLREVYRVRGALIVIVFWAGLVALVVAALAGLFAARAVTRPIRGVTAAARAIAAGYTDRRAPPSGPDETVELAHAFNAMLEEVLRQRRAERDLLANVSHELSAPLGIILAYAEALADGVLEGSDHRERALRAITAESRRLGRLVGDLLDLALLESGQARLTLAMAQPETLLADVRDRMAPVAERAGLTVVLALAPALPPLCTDGARLESVLVNLIANAIAHTPRGGQIILSAARAREPLPATTRDLGPSRKNYPSAPVIGHSGNTVASAPEGVVLAVRDTGHGIDPEDLPRIFERFYRGDKSRDRREDSAGSVGLGLAICRQTMHILGGTISAESPGIGKGSTFTIWLPAGRQSPQPLSSSSIPCR